ncbi:hypothetical protein F4818DRAFT_416084 [Hypoxylon cercidicola]|nr:hypothetical protein F4818DRAFT_416084 [Hypoxylon cercidicola]
MRSRSVSASCSLLGFFSLTASLFPSTRSSCHVFSSPCGGHQVLVSLAGILPLIHIASCVRRFPWPLEICPGKSKRDGLKLLYNLPRKGASYHPPLAAWDNRKYMVKHA